MVSSADLGRVTGTLCGALVIGLNVALGPRASAVASVTTVSCQGITHLLTSSLTNFEVHIGLSPCGTTKTTETSVTTLVTFNEGRIVCEGGSPVVGFDILVGSTTGELGITSTSRGTILLRGPLLIGGCRIGFRTFTSGTVDESDPSEAVGLTSSGASLFSHASIVNGVVFEDGAIGVRETSRPTGWFGGDISLQLCSDYSGVVDFGDVVTTTSLGAVTPTRDLTLGVWV